MGHEAARAVSGTSEGRGSRTPPTGHAPVATSGPDRAAERRTRFERMYRENAGRVYALCLRLAGEPALAEELAQEAFVRAWEKLDSFRGESRFATWMHRLTVNVVYNAFRSRSRRPSRSEEPGTLELLDGGEDPSPTVLRIALDRAIGTLPDRARMVFVLYDVEGYPQEEIAEMMGTTVGTVKSQLHRARKLLREELAP